MSLPSASRPYLVKQTFDTVKKIRERGITILLVEQNVFHALSLAEKAYVFENGTVAYQGPGKDLLENDQIKEAYLGI